jgi:hypothetical protein
MYYHGICSAQVRYSSSICSIKVGALVVRLKLSIIMSFLGSDERRLQTIKKISSYVRCDIEIIMVDANNISINHVPNFLNYFHLPESTIYEALNFGIMSSSADYYLVCGADDDLIIDTIVESIVENEPFDLLSGKVKSGDHFFKPTKNNFPFSHMTYISQHSVGLVIRRKIHAFTGLYETNFQIASDAKFILISKSRGYSFKETEKLFGNYGEFGVSSLKKTRAYREMIFISLSFRKYLSVVYYLIRSFIEIKR